MVSAARTPRAAAEPAARPELPWLAPRLRETLATQKAHALLVHGPAGVGQFDFAMALARAWLCETPESARDGGLACGHCASCHLVDERSHPDLRLVVPEIDRAEAGLPVDESVQSDGESKKRKPSREIKVEQVRTALNFAELTAGRSRHKVLVLSPAEALNPFGANALLKTLEEPGGGMRFVLACGAIDALLPTIRSRCQAVGLVPPPREEAVAWLAAQGVAEAGVVLDAAGGQPQAALAWHRQGLTAEVWQQFPAWAARGEAQPVAAWPLPVLVDALARLAHDRVRVSLGQPPRFFAQARLAGGDVSALLRWAQALRAHARTAEHPYSASLAAEALMVEARMAMAAA